MSNEYKDWLLFLRQDINYKLGRFVALNTAGVYHSLSLDRESAWNSLDPEAAESAVTELVWECTCGVSAVYPVMREHCDKANPDFILDRNAVYKAIPIVCNTDDKWRTFFRELGAYGKNMTSCLKTITLASAEDMAKILAVIVEENT